MSPATTSPSIPLGIGYYSAPEAARLLRVPPRNIRRWLGGYSFARGTACTNMPPLWTPQLPANDDTIELGFRDLIELRFVAAFIAHGLALKTIRACLTTARELVDSDRPFSTRRFKTDGRRIFLETLHRHGADAANALPPDAHLSARELLDLKSKQYVLSGIVDRTFRDLDIADDVVTRWRPFHGKPSIVIDPARSFGQPTVASLPVPTVAIAGAASAEGSARRAAFLYDLPLGEVRDAIRFEEELAAA